jgi:hypothetical protein
MLKKIKHIAIQSVAVLFILQVCFTFSGILIENIQQVRYENRIARNLKAVHKEFSLNDWQQLNNKKEIEVNHVFYDVISAKKVGGLVVVKMVRDSFESEFRITFQNVLNKKSNGSSGKKKIFKPYSIKIIFNEVKTNSTPALTDYFLKPNFPFLNIETNKINKSVYKPPC